MGRKRNTYAFTSVGSAKDRGGPVKPNNICFTERGVGYRFEGYRLYASVKAV
jgi:hypothetical protein